MIRDLIGKADDAALQTLTADEYDRLANADQTIERLNKEKRELVSAVLAKDGRYGIAIGANASPHSKRSAWPEAMLPKTRFEPKSH